MAILAKATADALVYETGFQRASFHPGDEIEPAIPSRSIQLAGAVIPGGYGATAVVQIKIITAAVIDGYLTLGQAEKILRDLQAAVAAARAGQAAAMKAIDERPGYV